MESIDFRCQVRFLHRQRLFSPFELNTCASQFLASLKKQCANISSGDTRNNCIVRLSEPRGLRIVSGGSSSSAAMGGSGSNRRSDEGFESDSEHSDHVAHNYAVLGGNGSNCMENECGNSSGVNSSGSDVDETDGVAKLQTAASVTSSSLSSSATTTVAERNSDILIESRVSDILSCQNPASLARVVLFTLRCEKRCDALDIIAVECSGVEAARILTRLCQKLCLSQQQQHQLKSAKMVVERTAKVQDSGKMATVSSIQSAIQNGSQRSSCRSKSSQRSAAPTQCGGPPSSTSQPPPVTMASGHQVETGNTREMIRRLERQKSWMEGAPKSLSSSQRSSYRASRACGEPALDNTCHHIQQQLQQQQADGCVTNKDTPKLKIGNRDTCIVSLQTPDMPLTAATRQSRRDSSCVVAKRESVAAAAVMNKVDAHLPRPPVSLKKKPSLLNHLLNDELEAVLQAQIAERTNVKQAQVTKNDSAAKSVNGASQAPTKLKRDKSKTRSFLSKFTGSHDKAASESQQSHQQPPQQANGETKKVERGRSMMRSSTPWNRTPSQPAPTNRNHISTSNHTASNHGNNNNNNNNTFLIPTKSGQEFTNSPYPKDAPVANYMQQHPIYLSAPAAFPVHLAFPRPAAFSAVAPPWYWPTNEADANHAANSIATSTAANGQHLMYYANDVHRLRSRSQSPGRRLLPAARVVTSYQPVSLPHWRNNNGGSDYCEPAAKNGSNKTISKSKSVQKHGAKNGSQNYTNSQSPDTPDCDLRKVSFHAFATVQLVD